jgi:predicted enzyme related to lactoylglutathione lyase
MSPTSVHGKICYIELPAHDVAASAAFYSAVFGWSMRTRGDGTQAFDDTTGQVSGAFVTGRDPAAAPGLLLYIMVDDAVAACDTVEAKGGTVVQRVEPGAREIVARFRDPAGNVLGLYQEPSHAPPA